MAAVCGDCGTAWVKGHVCDPQRKELWQAFVEEKRQRAVIEENLKETEEFLKSKAGQFELYYAERERTKCSK